MYLNIIWLWLIWEETLLHGLLWLLVKGWGSLMRLHPKIKKYIFQIKGNKPNKRSLYQTNILCTYLNFNNQHAVLCYMFYQLPKDMLSFKKCYIQVILFKHNQMLQVQVLSNPADNWRLYTWQKYLCWTTWELRICELLTFWAGCVRFPNSVLGSYCIKDICEGWREVLFICCPNCNDPVAKFFGIVPINDILEVFCHSFFLLS